MKKDEVIKKLQAIPGNPECCVFDWRQNLSMDSGEGSGYGIYSKFDIELQKKNDIPKGSRPWIAIGFENIDYNDSGQSIKDLEDEIDISAK